MNAKLVLLLAVTLGLSLVGRLQAGPRASASYNILADSIDDGGKRATSALYTNDGSVGGVASSVGTGGGAAPPIAKNGYVGQLYEVTGLALSAPAGLAVNEGATRQIVATQLLDDATTLVVTGASSVAWSVVSGPLTSISATGLATAGIVYENTGATVQGVYGGFTSFLTLTVVDSNADNFGAYAGDGVGDDWQVQYFGQPPNANAAPAADPDRDGQDNRFEFIAGLVPTDANSYFRLRIERPFVTGFGGSGTETKIIFSPVLGNRSYVLKKKSSLTGGTYTAIGGYGISNNGQERTITDLTINGDGTRFYSVEITK